MTNKEAIEWIKAHHDFEMDGCRDSQAMRLAIKALEQIDLIKFNIHALNKLIEEADNE